MIDIQSDSVLKKKSFKTATVHLGSSKHRLFLSCQCTTSNNEDSHPDNTRFLFLFSFCFNKLYFKKKRKKKKKASLECNPFCTLFIMR